MVGGSTNISLDSHSQSFCVTFKWDRDGEMETGYTGALVLLAIPHVYKSTAYSRGVWQRPMPPHTAHAWWVFTPFLTGCSQMTEPNLWGWGWDPGVCSPCWGFIFRPHIEQPIRTLPLPAHICFLLKQYSITLQFWRKLSTTPLDHIPLSLRHNAGRGDDDTNCVTTIWLVMGTHIGLIASEGQNWGQHWLPTSLHPCQHLSFGVLMIALLMRWNLKAILVCTFPMVKDGERFFSSTYLYFSFWGPFIQSISHYWLMDFSVCVFAVL